MQHKNLQDFSNKFTSEIEKGLSKKFGFVKKDTIKIKTNPKYRCVDEASLGIEEENKQEDIQ